MQNSQIEIVTPRPDLQAGWRRLYDGYATLYKREMTDEVAAAVWSWITDPDHESEGLIALQDGNPVGLAHYRRMPSPLRGADVGFLDDLFVDPQCRGNGIADKLFARLAEIGGERNWGVIRWITADDNYRARSLYDRLAKKTMWNTYEMAV